MNKRSIAIIALIIGIATLLVFVYTVTPGMLRPSGAAIKTQEQAIEKIGNISEDVQNIGSTLEDLDQSIG